VRRLLQASVDEVGIERGDGPVVDAFLQAGLTVLVIAPGQVKNLRSRYGSAGNKDDRFDAYVLADVVRADRARLRPLVRDSAATTAICTTVPARRDLVGHRVAAAKPAPRPPPARRGHLDDRLGHANLRVRGPAGKRSRAYGLAARCPARLQIWTDLDAPRRFGMPIWPSTQRSTWRPTSERFVVR
jgi:transposase